MEGPRIDLNLLRVLEALFEEGSASGAARRLGVSQPALSAGLARLRSYFRDPLFVRAGAGMRPTAFALSLRQPIGNALAIVRTEVTPKADFVAAETTRTFTFTTSDVGELCFLPRLLAAFALRAPRATLKCVTLPPEDVTRAILAGEVDIAAGYFPDLVTPELEQRLLFKHPFVCIARRDHPVLGDTISMETFLQASHAVVRQRGRSQELVERTFCDMGLERRVLLQSPHFMSLPLLIASSDLLSVVPRAVATFFPESAALKMLEPPLPLPLIPIAFHWARRAAADPAVRWLVQLMDELFLDKDPTDSG